MTDSLSKRSVHTTKQARVGTKKKSDPSRRSVKIPLHLTPAESAILTGRAKAKKLSVQDYIRKELLGE